MMFFCYFTVYYFRFFSVLSGLVRPCTQAMFLTTFPTLISFCYIREVCDSLLMDANTTFHRFVLCALVPPLLLNTNATLSLKPQTLHALRGSDDPNGIFDFFTKKRSVLLNFYVFYVIMLL
jgi:hypothetical protein